MRAHEANRRALAKDISAAVLGTGLDESFAQWSDDTWKLLTGRLRPRGGPRVPSPDTQALVGDLLEVARAAA